MKLELKLRRVDVERDVKHYEIHLRQWNEKTDGILKLRMTQSVSRDNETSVPRVVDLS